MDILIMGAGAMGTAIGGFMALNGHNITLVGREKTVAAIKSKGLHITGIWGDHHVNTLSVVADIKEIASQKYELIIVAVKSYDTETSAQILAPCVDADTFICSYQNGLGNAEILAAHYGWQQVVGARVIFGARVNTPGTVEITVIAAPTAIGAYQEGAPKEKAKEIATLMDESGIPTCYTDKIQTILWNKVAYNCALNPLSALLDVPYGRLAEEDYTRSIMEAVIRELYAVGTAMDIPLDPPDADAYIKKFYEKLLPPTAAHYASMREDLKNQRRTEIDALNGGIVQFGREHGIPCPANALLTALVHAREKK